MCGVRLVYPAVHHSLVLRADNLAEKNQWVSRLRMHVKGQGAPPSPPQESKEDTAKAAPTDAEASDTEKDKGAEGEGEVRSSTVLLSYSLFSVNVSQRRSILVYRAALFEHSVRGGASVGIETLVCGGVTLFVGQQETCLQV